MKPFQFSIPIADLHADAAMRTDRDRLNRYLTAYRRLLRFRLTARSEMI